MSFKSFLISKTFFKHTAIMLVVLIVILFSTIKALDVYTDHGEYIKIPNLTSCDADSLAFLASEDELRYVVVDSVYADDKYPGTVVMQNPKPGAKVKSGRKVYLTIVAKTPEMVKMPNLIDLSIRRAIDVLQYAHLEVEAVEFVNDIALNAVLAQMYKGDTIGMDSLLPSNSKIRLIAGNGYRNSGVNVPFLLGKTPAQARKIILKSSFNPGRIDTLWENFEKGWRVYEQTPHVDPLDPVRFPLGRKINIKVRSDMGYNFDSVLNYYQLPDSLRYDSLLTEQLTFE